jgi:virginiamycin B lyase
MPRKARISRSIQFHVLCALICFALLGLRVVNQPVAAAASEGPDGHPQITQRKLPLGKYHPASIVAGPNGSAWFAINSATGPGEVRYAQVERISESGELTPFAVGPFVWDVARGPGGIWFTRDGHVGRIGPGGQVQQFPVATGQSDSLSIASGAGYMWLTKRFDRGHDAIQRISRNGKVKAFRLPLKESDPSSITRGSGGAMWFTEYFGERIGRITSNGKITEFPLGVQPFGGIAAGPEGDLWFATFGALGRLSPSSGKVTLFWRHGVGGGPVLAGPDGRIWFAQDFGKIGRITPGGHFSVIDLPGPVTRVRGLAVGSDGSVWYTAEERAGRPGVVGRITLGG